MKSLVFQKMINRFSKEWKKIIFSTFLALIFWFSTVRLSYIEKKVTLPLTYKNLPSNFVILNGYETNVTVLIKAKEDFFNNPNFTNVVKAFVYLDNARTGNNLYPVDLVLNAPIQDFSVRLLKEEVKLNIDYINSNYIGIKPNIVGIPSRGYFVDEIILQKTNILVIGPASLLSKLECLSTSPVSVENITNSLITNVSLVLSDIFSTPESTDVEMKVIVKSVEKMSNL